MVYQAKCPGCGKNLRLKLKKDSSGDVDIYYCGYCGRSVGVVSKS